MIQIVEILGQTDQGRSRPLHCRGDDGNLYCVKGLPRSSQAAEWVCGHLGRALGLPIPEFCVVEISYELLEMSPPEWHWIGSGPAFASRWVDDTSWLEVASVAKVPVDLQRDILVFDWWIQNPDRYPENTNLLWQAASQSLVVIDHNCAFDQSLTLSSFLENHLFKDQWQYIDLERRAQYYDRFMHALGALNADYANLPAAWSWQDRDETVPSDFCSTTTHIALYRCFLDEFWKEG